MKDKEHIGDELSAKSGFKRGPVEKARITGRVSYKLFGPDGKLKQEGESRNLVVTEGDNYIADALATTPAMTAMDCIPLGDGWTSAAKGDVWLTSGFTGNGHDTVNQGGFDAGYPQVKGAGADAKVLVYKATFEAAYATHDGIDEAIISNVNPDGSGGDPGGGGDYILAHGEITPVVNKGASDTLEVTWEITFLGA